MGAGDAEEPVNENKIIIDSQRTIYEHSGNHRCRSCTATGCPRLGEAEFRLASIKEQRRADRQATQAVEGSDV